MIAGDNGPLQSDSAHREATEATLKCIRAARSIRKEYFGDDLFGEPGWDIPLDLYEADLSRTPMQVSGIGLEWRIPATTVVRWLKAFEARDLIERRPDPKDARSVLVSLSPIARTAMDSLFDRLGARMARLQKPD